MAHPFSDFVKYVGTDFQGYILPIIPAGATLTEKSKLNDQQLGKIPGEWRDELKAWRGFPGWQAHHASAGHMRFWQRWQEQAKVSIAIGLNTRIWTAIDIDIDNKAVADEAEKFVQLELGPPGAVRERDGSPRRVLFYERDQHTGPIHRRHVAFTHPDMADPTKPWLVELLGNGQQVIIEGPHKSGAMHHWRDGIGLIEGRETMRSNLVNMDRTWGMMQRLGQWIATQPGWTLRNASNSLPPGGDSAAHKIRDLMSPNLSMDFDVLAQCMAAIDLDDPQFDYDAFITLLRAICAACGGDMVFFTETVWPWVCTNQKQAHGAGPRTEEQGIEWLETRWNSFTDSQLGAEYVYNRATEFGCTAGHDLLGATQRDQAMEMINASPDVETPQDGAGPTPSLLPGAGAPGTGGPLPFADTNTQVALAFEGANADKWRYNVDSRKWYAFTDGYWQDNPHMVDDLQPMMSRLSQQILATVRGPSGVSRARALESTGNILAVSRLIERRSPLGVRNSAWDTHHHLLNTPAGVVDLHTGEWRGHTPSLLIRGMTLVAPNMIDYGNWELICPKWLNLIRNLAGDDRPNVEPLLQRWWGNNFTGDLMHQHVLFMQGGPGTRACRSR
jgi:hypothetical protein